MMPELTTLQRLRQIRTITKNYHALRGLQGVPFGILCLIVAWFELGWLHLPEQWINVGAYALLIGFVIALVLYPLIGDYYDRLFGRVERVKRNALDTIIAVLGIAVLLLAGIRIDSNMNLPVSATGLALAIWFFICWWHTNAFRTHILILALMTAVLGLLPLAGFTSASKLFLPGHGGYELVFGALLTIGGLCDHLLLIEAFRHTLRVHNDETI